MEGWLEKQGTVVKNWKRRWFVLYPDGEDAFFLRYFTAEDKKVEKGFFRILIDSSISGLDDGYGGGSKRNLFVLQAAGNKNKDFILLSAETDDKKSNWVEKIQQSIDSIRERVEASWDNDT